MLNVLANVAGGSKAAVAEVRVALQGISEWFDEYIAAEEADPSQVSLRYAFPLKNFVRKTDFNFISLVSTLNDMSGTRVT